MDECSPYLELPRRSLEHVLQERVAARRDPVWPPPATTRYAEQLTELRLRVAELKVPACIGASLYDLYRR